MTNWLFVLLLLNLTLLLHFSRDRSHALPTQRGVEVWVTWLGGERGGMSQHGTSTAGGCAFQDFPISLLPLEPCGGWDIQALSKLQCYLLYNISFQFSQWLLSPFLSLAAVLFFLHPFCFSPISWSLCSVRETGLLRGNTWPCCLAQQPAAALRIKQGQLLPPQLQWCSGGLNVAPGDLDLSVLLGLSMASKALCCGKFPD